MHTDILIVGAGPAGFNAAKAASQSGKEVTLAGAEPYPPYWRPRLPEIIHTGAPAESILIQDAGWYKSRGIRFLPSKKAAGIDLSKKSVRWEDGSFTEYGSLILAFGSLPNIPTVPSAEKVYPLRSCRDAAEIRRKCEQTGKAFVVGGGVLGLETAFAVAQSGARVIVYDINDYPLSRQLDREGGLFLKKLLEKEKVVLRAGADLNDLREEIEGACVIAAAGVRPDVGLAKECGIKTNRGILVDGEMRTSAAAVYACGDAAEFSGAVPGLMTIAAKQGETAGINASGGHSVYEAVLPSPMTKVAGISVLSIGSVKAGEGSKIFRSVGDKDYAMAVVTGGKLTGAALIGNISLGIKLKKRMESGAEIGPVSSFDDIARAVG